MLENTGYSDEMLAELGYGYRERPKIQRTLALLPQEHRGMFLLLVTVGMGQGEGAKNARELAVAYLRQYRVN